jgi:hypothetical protein
MSALAVSPAETMIGTEPLCEIVETAIYSGYLAEGIPISAMLVGPSGAGKSKVLMQYQNSIGCHVTTDVTSMGLQELLALDKQEKLRFIVIPDFNIVLSHRQSTLQLTIGNLLSMTSEGTIRIDDGRAVKEAKHGPVGILSAMTREIYAGMGKKWSALGFSRRFLPINYDYSLPTREKIQRGIANGLVTMLHLAERNITAPERNINVAISEEESNRIMSYSHDLATNIGWLPAKGRSREGQFKPKAIFVGKQIEFSPHIVLRTLARAHALRDGRREVNDSDLEFVMKVIAFTRFDQPVML